jgi:transcriptional regulator with XRE-family HTH domain
MNQINFGENVRKIRAVKGYTQDYMATRLGFKHQNQYSRIENSPKIPVMKTVNGIAAIFETSVAELLTTQVRLDTPEKQKARIGIYTSIIFFIAIGVGIICANPAWEYVDYFCMLQGTPEGWRVMARMSGGCVPMVICLWTAKKVRRRYKAAYGI